MIETKTISDSHNKKDHWEKVYQHQPLHTSGWYQPIPSSSLQLIQAGDFSKNQSVIDIGGGDSLLVDHLLEMGYSDISVLDISEAAIERAKKRLGELTKRVDWIYSDITEFQINKTFDLWHDRACLHFLTQIDELNLYKDKVNRSVSSGGTMILGTFSKTGPKKCSGLPIRQYDSTELTELFSEYFELSETFESVHVTPSGNTQNYVFCRFKKK